jgi:hypothetical protein
LSKSSVDWTLVRVPFIEFTDAMGSIVINMEDCLGNKVSSANIAAFLIKQLSDKTYFSKSPFIANV